MRPDDEVGDAGLVFDGHEDALRAAGPLAHQYEARHRHAPPGRDFGKPLAFENAPTIEAFPQERQRMGLQRKMQMAIILDHLFARRHRRQMGVGFAVGKSGAREQRQIVLVAGAPQRAQRP